jgi:hypothetical protein
MYQRYRPLFQAIDSEALFVQIGESRADVGAIRKGLIPSSIAMHASLAQ